MSEENRKGGAMDYDPHPQTAMEQCTHLIAFRASNYELFRYPTRGEYLITVIEIQLLFREQEGESASDLIAEFLSNAWAIIINDLPSTKKRTVTSTFHHEEIFFKLVDCSDPLMFSLLVAESSAAHRPRLLSMAAHACSVVT